METTLSTKKERTTFKRSLRTVNILFVTTLVVCSVSFFSIFLMLSENISRISAVLFLLTIFPLFYFMVRIKKLDMVLSKYRKDIKRKKDIIYLNRCIDSFLSGDYDNVKFIYNNCLKTDSYRFLINGMYTTYNYFQGDKEKAMERINNWKINI